MNFKRYISLMLIIILAFVPLAHSQAASRANPESSISSYDKNFPEHLSESNLYAQAAVLIDGKTGRVLFSKDMDKKMYPASTTKIMTALLALENTSLGSLTTCSLNSTRSEASWIPVKYKEQYTIEQLLHALMLKSANDAAIVLAEEVAGSVETFAQMMNAKAVRLGAENTNFVNPNGLPDTNHYSTARDLSLIAMEAMKNSTFRKIITTLSYTLPANDLRDTDVTVKNNNAFLFSSGDSSFSYEYGVGIKTGYTNAAQHCFVGAAEKDGMLLISVVLGSTKDGKWMDTQKLMDYGFATSQPLDVISMYEDNPHKVLVLGAADGDTKDGFISLDIHPDDKALLEGYFDTEENIRSIKNNLKEYITITSKPEINAPLRANDELATLTFQAPFMPDPVSVRLVAISDVAMKAVLTQQPISTPDATSVSSALNFNTAPTTSNKKKLLGFLLLIPAAIIVLIVMVIIISSLGKNKKKSRKKVRNYSSEYRQY
ncbi:MAG: D-alanyl-D-alanine carboxypeptidase family protein [Christensenellales bacterium]|jgi:D-alanyl-D-alanine carboxypeptidase